MRTTYNDKHFTFNCISIKLTVSFYLTYLNKRNNIGTNNNLHCLGEYSCLQVDLMFARQLSFFLVTIYVPCMMTVTVSWFSFWLDHKAVRLKRPIIRPRLFIKMFVKNRLNPYVTLKCCNCYFLTLEQLKSSILSTSDIYIFLLLKILS